MPAFDAGARTAAQRVREAKRALEKAERELAEERAGRFGPDTFRTGTVLRFDKSFASGETYPYAAIKTNDGYWRTCGPTAGGKAWTWKELVDWFNSGTPVKKVFVAVEGSMPELEQGQTLKAAVNRVAATYPTLTFDFELPSSEYDLLRSVFIPRPIARTCHVYGCDRTAIKFSDRCDLH